MSGYRANAESLGDLSIMDTSVVMSHFPLLILLGFLPFPFNQAPDKCA